VTPFFVDGAIAALVGWNRLRSRWLDAVRMNAGGLGGLESLQDFIALPRDEEGRLIIPSGSGGGIGGGEQEDSLTNCLAAARARSWCRQRRGTTARQRTL
jgi:hypothetical protein